MNGDNDSPAHNLPPQTCELLSLQAEEPTCRASSPNHSSLHTQEEASLNEEVRSNELPQEENTTIGASEGSAGPTISQLSTQPGATSFKQGSHLVDENKSHPPGEFVTGHLAVDDESQKKEESHTTISGSETPSATAGEAITPAHLQQITQSGDTTYEQQQPDMKCDSLGEFVTGRPPIPQKVVHIPLADIANEEACLQSTPIQDFKDGTLGEHASNPQVCVSFPLHGEQQIIPHENGTTAVNVDSPAELVTGQQLIFPNIVIPSLGNTNEEPCLPTTPSQNTAQPGEPKRFEALAEYDHSTEEILCSEPTKESLESVSRQECTDTYVG